MFKKILIANRGEIALRVIRACREMGIASVAIYSEADKDSLHVKMADEAICIGKASPQESYLVPARIMSAAEVSKAEAVHPGYGFLAESSEFAEICESCNIAFIGPSSQMIKKMGDKVGARKMMQKIGVPVIPGSDGCVKDSGEALKIAKKIGFPVMIKAKAGGGGRGIRIVSDEKELESGLSIAMAEASAAFGDGEVYIEKFLENPRHIEVQVLGDKYGNTIHLGERECSIQRRHQKLLEESPSPALSNEERCRLLEFAKMGVRNIGYINAGTLEFLYESGKFYFIEMNTRIQVEHPVTEMVSGVDIVKAQIEIAGGEEIPFKQEEIIFQGHAMEVRINAENPDKNFAPSPGIVKEFLLPGGPGVRIDTHVYPNYEVPPYYDSLIAKVIVHDRNRKETLERMRRALFECNINGIFTTLPFHRNLLENKDFIKGDFNVGFLDRMGKE